MKSILFTLITEPFTWFAVLILVENTVIIRKYLRWRAGTGFGESALKLLCCIGISIALLIITLIIFANLSPFTKRRSKVDVSPLAELSLEQVARMDESIIEKLKEYDFITNFRYDSKPVRQIIKTAWYRDEPKSWLSISAYVFKEEHDAVKNILSSSNSAPNIKIDHGNNTEAVLYDSRMLTTTDTLNFPNSDRYIRSIIRIGRTTIILTESQKYYNLDKDISSEFIKLLCELLEEEE